MVPQGSQEITPTLFLDWLKFSPWGGGGMNFAFVWKNWKILDFALEISNPLCLVLAIMSMQKSCLQQT